MKRLLPFAAVALATILSTQVAHAWGIGNSPVNPVGTFQYSGPTANSPGAYKYGYGDYSDRYGYRPDAPGNVNTNPGFPRPANLNEYRLMTPPPVYTPTTYGGYRGPTVGSILLSGVYR